MMKNKILITSLAALFTGAVSMASLAADDAMAAPATGAASASFAAIDANGDGMISVEEAQGSAALNDGFAASDANRDGHLDASEFSAFEATISTPAQ